MDISAQQVLSIHSGVWDATTKTRAHVAVTLPAGFVFRHVDAHSDPRTMAFYFSNVTGARKNEALVMRAVIARMIDSTVAHPRFMMPKIERV